jgi:DNA-binding transcriptional MerR regulator
MSRARKTDGGRQAAFDEDVVIPNKLYFRIREVSKLTNTKAYVLRYWETEFPVLKPERKSGQRLYRRKDVETVLKIKHLLYDQGFTIEGARRQLREKSGRPEEQKPLFRSGPDRAPLHVIKHELESILTMLSRKC